MALPTNVVQGNAAHVTHHNTIHALMPTGESVQIKTKAGVPVDGDFTSTPPNGTLALNTSTNRIYVRSSGVWLEAVPSSNAALKNTTNTFTQPQTIAGGTTATDRLNLGADTEFHRSTTDVINTDDSLQIKGPRPWADIKAYGATADEVTDDAPFIQAAIDACAHGGTVFIPRGMYRLASTLKIYTSGIRLLGQGGGHGGGASILWSDVPTGGTMVRVGPDAVNPTATPYSFTCENLRFDGDNTAGTCIHILLGNNHQLLNLLLSKFTGKGLRIGDDPTYHNTIQNFYSRQIHLLGSENATAAIYIDQQASEPLTFINTAISPNFPGTKLQRSIEIVSGHATFHGLNNGGTALDRYGISTNQAIGIYDWINEDTMPIVFNSSAHNKGSVLSRCDLRSCNPISGEYAINVGGIGNGGTIHLDSMRIDGVPGATVAPNILCSGLVIADGVNFTTAGSGGDGNLAGQFLVTGSGRLIDHSRNKVRVVGGDFSVESVGDDYPRVELTASGTLRLGNGAVSPSTVGYGANDSGGSGFKVLRVVNGA